MNGESMATVYRKTFTKPLPGGAGAFVGKGKRFARWKDGRGKTRTTPLTTGRDGADRIVCAVASLLRVFVYPSAAFGRNQSRTDFQIRPKDGLGSPSCENARRTRKP